MNSSIQSSDCQLPKSHRALPNKVQAEAYIAINIGKFAVMTPVRQKDEFTHITTKRYSVIDILPLQ